MTRNGFVRSNRKRKRERRGDVFVSPSVPQKTLFFHFFFFSVASLRSAVLGATRVSDNLSRIRGPRNGDREPPSMGGFLRFERSRSCAQICLDCSVITILLPIHSTNHHTSLLVSRVESHNPTPDFQIYQYCSSPSGLRTPMYQISTSPLYITPTFLAINRAAAAAPPTLRVGTVPLVSLGLLFGLQAPRTQRLLPEFVKHIAVHAASAAALLDLAHAGEGNLGVQFCGRRGSLHLDGTQYGFTVLVFSLEFPQAVDTRPRAVAADAQPAIRCVTFQGVFDLVLDLLRAEVSGVKIVLLATPYAHVTPHGLSVGTPGAAVTGEALCHAVRVSVAEGVEPARLRVPVIPREAHGDVEKPGSAGVL